MFRYVFGGLQKIYVFVTLYVKNQFSLLTMAFAFNKLMICSLLIVSKVVVKYRYGVGLRDLEYGYAE